MGDVHESLAVLAREQHGVVARAQCLAAGMSGRTVDDWIRRCRLDQLHPGIYAVAGAPRTWEMRLKAAELAIGPGGSVSHRSGTRLWGLREFDEIEVIVPYTRCLGFVV
ncbi:MAG TPA: type IV toxin-antitoxin system AbiEi family antitoxin domain-containing protein [Acidimicrobiales bacterium]